MAKDDLTLVRLVQLDDRGGDVKAIKRMVSRADVNFPRERFDDHFGKKLEAAVKRFQRKHGLEVDGIVGYMTFKALVPFADAFASKLLRDFEKERIGDWGIVGRKTA